MNIFARPRVLRYNATCNICRANGIGGKGNGENIATAKKVSDDKPTTTELAIIDERTIRDRIYEVRGLKVMLDFELAKIYGYTTKAFNQQEKNTLKNLMMTFGFS